MDSLSPAEQRRNLLLMFMGVEGAPQFTPIQIMKGIFVYIQEARKDWIRPGASYDFVPYNYGPCSFEVYSDLDFLENKGLIGSSPVPGYSWSIFYLTNKGKMVVSDIIDKFPKDAAEYAAAVSRFVRSLGTRELLEKIYDEYPEFATNSVFKRSK